MITPRSFTENVIALPSLLKVDRKDLTLSFPFLQLSEEVSIYPSDAFLQILQEPSKQLTRGLDLDLEQNKGIRSSESEHKFGNLSHKNIFFLLRRRLPLLIYSVTHY